MRSRNHQGRLRVRLSLRSCGSTPSILYSADNAVTNAEHRQGGWRCWLSLVQLFSTNKQALLFSLSLLPSRHVLRPTPLRHLLPTVILSYLRLTIGIPATLSPFTTPCPLFGAITLTAQPLSPLRSSAPAVFADLMWSTRLHPPAMPSRLTQIRTKRTVRRTKV